MVADIVLLLLSIICLVAGLLGSFLPIPGPPLSFLGILFLEWSRFADFSNRLLWSLGLLTLAIALVDYYFPIYGLHKFGGTRAGMWGATIGIIVGLFLGPWGILLGAFGGGLIGELLAGQDSAAATKAALGSFAGFLFGVLLKLAICVAMLWYAGAALWAYAFG